MRMQGKRLSIGIVARLIFSALVFLRFTGVEANAQVEGQGIRSVSSNDSRNQARSSEDIQLSPGDLIEVNVFDTPEMSGKYRISTSGDIDLVLAGTIHVQGLSSRAASSLVEQRLQSRNLLIDPHVTIFVIDYVDQGISVLGEVKSPGTYPLMGEHRFFDAISAAGGFTNSAANEATVIHKSDPLHPEVLSLTSKPELQGSYDVQIQPGDKIIVSAVGVVYVLGEVGRPGGFVLARNEERYTVTKVLALAQGVTHTAKIDSAVILRKTGNDVTQTPVPIKKILQNKAPDTALLAGDVLYVPSSSVKLIGYRALEAAFATGTGLAIYGRF
jgi:polysaccharide export outer membrane protein